MNDEQRQLLQDFIEDNWGGFEQFLVRRGYGIMEAEDKAIELIDTFENLTTNGK